VILSRTERRATTARQDGNGASGLEKNKKKIVKIKKSAFSAQQDQGSKADGLMELKLLRIKGVLIFRY
jgi:hypothetical protein